MELKQEEDFTSVFEVGYGLTNDVPDDITVTLTEIGGKNTETDTFEVPTIPM